ncbi:MAG: hypothetical protein IJH54_00310 [Clostridia bacterium]|nr:hypothetical protein [Clostridia bacterium]
MKRTWAILLLALLLLLPGAASRAEALRRTVPDTYLTDCPQHGEVHSLLFQGDRELLVWTPFDYDPSTQYDVVFLMHGDGDDIRGWLCVPHAVYGGKTTGRNILDWLANEGLCRPFLVVCIDNNVTGYGKRILEDLPPALAFVAEKFSTYAREGTEAAVIEARDHFVVGGLSRGCIYAYSVLEKEPQYAANYLCLSCGGSREALEAALQASDFALEKYFAAVGVGDETFYWASRRTYERVSPFAGQAQLVEYAHGHDWTTWFSGLYDGLRFLLPPVEP